MIAADAIVLAVTWMRTFRQWRDVRTHNLTASLSTRLLRDGELRQIYSCD